MNELLLTNEKHLLTLIRYEYFKKKPLSDSYNNFCKTLGNDAVCFKDFEFWWLRFEKGDFELDLEAKRVKSADFIDIPDLCVQKIIEKLNWTSRCMLRKTSKRYRQLVDQPHVINKIKFKNYEFEISMKIDKEKLKYKNFVWGSCRKKDDENDLNIVRSNFLFGFGDHAHSDLFLAISNPNVKHKKLHIYLNRMSIKVPMTPFFESLTHQIHVESLKMEFNGEYYPDEPRIDCENDVLFILERLKPGVLKTIDLTCISLEMYISTERLVKTEQWKQAKQLISDNLVRFEIEDLFGFDQIDAFHWGTNSQDIVDLMNAFQFSPTFISCQLGMGHFPDAEMLEELGEQGFPFFDRNLCVDVNRCDLIIKRV